MGITSPGEMYSNPPIYRIRYVRNARVTEYWGNISDNSRIFLHTHWQITIQYISPGDFSPKSATIYKKVKYTIVRYCNYIVYTLCCIKECTKCCPFILSALTSTQFFDSALSGTESTKNANICVQFQMFSKSCGMELFKQFRPQNLVTCLLTYVQSRLWTYLTICEEFCRRKNGPNGLTKETNLENSRETISLICAFFVSKRFVSFLFSIVLLQQ